MSGSRRFVAIQEVRYFQHYEVWASSKAEATRIARGEEPGRRALGRSKHHDHQHPKVKEEPAELKGGSSGE